ncbi:MAG: ABC transporter substrate-binding protein [Acidimicrobiales bacterium]
MRNSRVVRMVALAGALSILAAACGGGGNGQPSQTTSATPDSTVTATTAPPPKSGGSIKMGMFSETAGLDPVVTNGGGTTGTTELAAIYDTVMRYDTTTKKFEPQTADSLTPNGDSSEWVLKLRAGIKFTDGTDYDADAVVFGMKRQSLFGSRAAGLLANIKDYVVVDKLTVRFVLTAPWSNFPYVLSYTPGLIPSPTAIKAACGPNQETVPSKCTFNTKPIGAGAFKVDSYKPKESINLARNDSYWNGKPYLDALSFVVLSGAPASYDALTTDTLQVVFLREPEIVKKATDEKKVDSYVNLQWLGGVALLNNGKLNCKGSLPAPNCTGKPDGVTTLDTITADKRVRQAIAFALDPNVINQRANASAGYPGGEFFQKTSKWASAAPVNTYNLESAKKLVDEVKKEGKWDGSIRVNCHNAPSRQSWAEAMRTLLTAAGFTVKLKNDYDTNALIADILTNKSYDVGCWGFNFAEEAPEIALQQAVLSTSAANAMNYVNIDVDAQIKMVREGKTEADRKAALEKIQDIWRTDMPTPVYEAIPEMIAWQKRVHGLKMTVGTVVLFDKAWVG